MREWSLFDLIEGLNDGVMTSEALVRFYLNQIARLDPSLNAVAELNPDALKIAKRMDKERKNHHVRSLLHGIPLLIKDNINTHDHMHTTANSLALSDLIAPYEASIVKKLRKAGAIILGKANLSEFAYFMSTNKMPSGYGSRNGQVKSPYDYRIDPLGSSTGSAVAVAANMIPIAIGTETNGSLMAPAYQNSIVSMKPTLGLVSRHGIIPITAKQDTAGPMARTVAECAVLLDIIAGSDPLDAQTKEAHLGQKALSSAYKLDTNGKTVGILSFSKYPYDETDLAILHEARSVLAGRGLNVVDVEIKPNPMKNDVTMIPEFKHDLNRYLQSVKGYTKMISLSDIIAFNKEDPEKRMKYGQTILEAADQTSGDLLDATYLANRESLLKEANRLETMMQELHIDALISTKWTSYAPIAGNPSICVPAKPLIDLTPKSLIFVGKKWDDALLIAIAHTYEQATHHRIPPKLDLVDKK